MKYFWDIVETIDRNSCPGFEHFHWQHNLWLVIFLAFVFVFSLVYRKAGACNLCSETGHGVRPEGCRAPYCRKHIKVLFSLALIADAIFKFIIVAVNHISILNYMPLQLCYISVMLVIIHAFIKEESPANKYIGNFLYIVGLPAGLSALLFPAWKALPAFANAMSLHSFSSHIIFVTYIVMLLAVGEIRPELRTIWVSVAALILMSSGVYAFDVTFDMNYMYLLHLSAGSPLAPFEALGDYRIGYAIILAALILVMYIVPVIVKRISNNSKKQLTH
ncbi:MAG: YwaF family protein [Clostridia bacterium]|nr:YwaF family protein [Clostridia bacterium]